LEDLLLMDARVAEDFLRSLPEEKRKTAEMIKEEKLVLQADKKIEEAIKWENLTFLKNEKALLLYIYTHI
jgi:hypothetical protein